MEKNFTDFQILIQQHANISTYDVDLILFSLHIETNMSAGIILEDEKLKDKGKEYLLNKIDELIIMLKKDLGYVDHLE
jgi:hypothetical protein